MIELETLAGEFSLLFFHIFLNKGVPTIQSNFRVTNRVTNRRQLHSCFVIHAFNCVLRPES